MHCGRVVPCGARGSILANSKVDVRDGVFSPIIRTSCSMATAMAMGMPMPSTKSISVRRVVVCHHGEDGSSSRRISYKRRQQLPRPKGLFPVTTHETDVFEKNHYQQQQQERQKTRAFEFSCENDETRSPSDEGFDLPPRNHVSDGSWFSRILTQIQVDLMWWSLHSSSFRLPHSLSSLFNPLPKGGRRGPSRRQPKGIPKPYDFQDFEGRIEPQDGYGHARALAVPVDIQNREISPRNKLQKQMLAHTIGRLDFFPWLERLKETYGASFMLLVVLGYCTQGFRCFPWLAMCYFFKDHLQVDPGTMQFLMSTTMLPMLAKPVYGIVSDSIYIQGAHRIPYLIIAGALQVVAWGAIVMHPGASSSVAVLTGVLTMSNMGAAISEVMNDALVAEAVKSKKGARQGELQSLAWLALATGGLVGNLMGGFALQRMDATTMFTIFMMLVGTQLLLCTTISERSFNLGNYSPQQQQQSTANTKVPSAIPSQERAVLLPQMIKRISSRCGFTTAEETLKPRESPRPKVSRPVECVDVKNLQAERPSGMRGQLALLAEMLRSPAVYRPLLWFLSSYAVIPLLGSTMFFYQTQYLGLDSSVIGLVKVVGQMGLVAGSVLYNRKLKKVPLRKLFGGTQILLSLCMLSDIVLVNRLNLRIGIPDSYFVLGASAFVEAIAQFKILPFIVLLARLCPPGSEGSLLSFFMSAQCLAGLTSAYLGVGLASFLHISANHFEELPLGILIQAGFALLPVLWINFIPEENGAVDSVKRLPEAISKDTGL